MIHKICTNKTVSQPFTTHHSLFTNYHLIGVAGVGMSALAQVLLAQGARVSGSDRFHDTGQKLTVLDKLREASLELVPQDGSGIKPGLSAVVVSSAIEDDNPDLTAAIRLKIPSIHRAEMLATLARGKRLIAVTGTAGKTTVTGMIGWILEQVGEDPTVVNGGPVLNWLNEQAIGNVRIGRSDTWVIEADESDRSLLQFDPDWAVVTNISKDHFEVAETEALFRAFAGKATQGVVGRLGQKNDIEAMNSFKPKVTAQGFTFEYGGITFGAALSGRHNAENALQSVLLCERMGIDLRMISEALSAFKGIQRRLERVGEAHDITVIDDYAHNPAKITAAWQAVQPSHKRVIAVWRPHGYRPLALMTDELVAVFGELARASDHVYLMPVYFAGGTADRSVTSEMFVERLHKNGVPSEFVPDYDELVSRLLNRVKPGDVVLFMGARDPDLPVVARRFVAELKHLLMNGMA
ncbi:UDP-N-acetylmuramate--L-alanine ligase [Verrucomicrobiota bacterium]